VRGAPIGRDPSRVCRRVTRRTVDLRAARYGSRMDTAASSLSPLDLFELLVEEALEEIPEPFASHLEQVAVIVESHADGRSLYGLYEGHPLTTGTVPSGAIPPRITIYMHPMVDHFREPAVLRHQVRVTVLHELGHHMGLDEDRLDELGYA
jgi:predicted Zn-dependent protease with MMP-like domain